MTRKEFLKYLTLVGVGIVQAPIIKISAARAAGAKPDVLIVGAGAAGLMAGYELQKQGISFKILEASSVFGGRVRKAEGFADFPIDTGAEWIHTDEPYELFAEIVNEDIIEFDDQVIPFDPKDYYWEDGSLIKEQGKAELEYKFKNTTWFDFLEKYIARDIQENIRLNSPVSKIDYTIDKTVITTVAGEIYEADQVLVTVPIGVLQAGLIDFVPAMPQKKTNAIRANAFPPGLKVFIEFSERFYPDAVSVGARYYYDAAYRKNTNKNVLALFIVGEKAGELTSLPNNAEIVDVILAELDDIFDGQASTSYVKHIVQNWSAEPYILGSYSHNESHQTRDAILAPLNDKVFFAGEALNEDFYSTVDGAAFSALSVLEKMIE